MAAESPARPPPTIMTSAWVVFGSIQCTEGSVLKKTAATVLGLAAADVTAASAALLGFTGSCFYYWWVGRSAAACHLHQSRLACRNIDTPALPMPDQRSAPNCFCQNVAPPPASPS